MILDKISSGMRFMEKKSRRSKKEWKWNSNIKSKYQKRKKPDDEYNERKTRSRYKRRNGQSIQGVGGSSSISIRNVE